MSFFTISTPFSTFCSMGFKGVDGAERNALGITVVVVVVVVFVPCTVEATPLPIGLLVLLLSDEARESKNDFGEGFRMSCRRIRGVTGVLADVLVSFGGAEVGGVGGAGLPRRIRH